MPDADVEPQAPETPGAPELTGRDRLVAAIRRPARTQLVVAVLLALVGFAAVVQIRANTDDDTYSGYRQQDLIDVLRGLGATTQRTQAEINRLTRTRADLLSATDKREAALTQAQKDEDNLNVLAGLVPVTGPGIRVTITEKTSTVPVGDMLDLVEQLRTAGAESISINGTVRVVAQSYFDAGVGGLDVDGTLLESPYVVDVIGVPGTLAESIDFGLGVRADLERDGSSVDIQQLDSLDITAVRKPGQPQFAQPGG